MARLTWLGWIGVSAVLVACGKSEGGPDPVSRDQLPARAAAIACEGLSGCCQRSGFMFDLAACKQGYTAEIEQNIAELDTANVDYDASAAGECLDALDAESFCGELDNEDVEACERIFRGKLAPGQPCSSSRECRREPGQNVSCNSEDGVEPQVCTLYDDEAPSRHGKLGEACYTTCFEGDDCSGGSVPLPAPAPGPGVPAPAPVDPAACYRTDGLWCNFGAGSPSCARLLPLGEECTSYDSCAGKAFCANDTGVCSAPRANGAQCSSADECQSGRCSYDGSSDAPEPVASYCVADEPITAEQCTVDFDEDVSGSSGDPSGSSGDDESPPAPAP